MVDGGDLKDTPGQGAGLVEDHGGHVGQGFQVVGALDQDTGPAGSADTGEEGKGNGDHQGAGTGHDQEGQGTINPLAPKGGAAQNQADNGRKDCQGQGRIAHHGGIDPGELGDEILGLGLPGGGVFHQVQNLGDGGFTELLGGADFQNAIEVDAAADDFVAGLCLPGDALAGEGGGIQGGGALLYNAVDGDLFAGLDHDNGADFHLVRVHLFKNPVMLDIGVVRADVHQLADVPAALAHGVALEELANLVEEHHADGLYVVALHGKAVLIDG